MTREQFIKAKKAEIRHKNAQQIWGFVNKIGGLFNKNFGNIEGFSNSGEGNPIARIAKNANNDAKKDD
jgi:hypothetical protein